MAKKYTVQESSRTWPQTGPGKIGQIENLDYEVVDRLLGNPNSFADKGIAWEITLEDGIEVELRSRTSYAGIELDELGGDGENGRWEIAANDDEEQAAMDFFRSLFPHLGRFDIKADAFSTWK